MGIINVFHYIWEFNLYLEILNFIDGLEIWWRHQKSYVNLITVLVFFERSYVVPTHAKFGLKLGFNWFRIYGEGPFEAPLEQ